MNGLGQNKTPQNKTPSNQQDIVEKNKKLIEQHELELLRKQEELRKIQDAKRISYRERGLFNEETAENLNDSVNLSDLSDLPNIPTPTINLSDLPNVPNKEETIELSQRLNELKNFNSSPEETGHKVEEVLSVSPEKSILESPNILDEKPLIVDSPKLEIPQIPNIEIKSSYYSSDKELPNKQSYSVTINSEGKPINYIYKDESLNNLNQAITEKTKAVEEFNVYCMRMPKLYGHMAEARAAKLNKNKELRQKQHETDSVYINKMTENAEKIKEESAIRQKFLGEKTAEISKELSKFKEPYFYDRVVKFLAGISSTLFDVKEYIFITISGLIILYFIYNRVYIVNFISDIFWKKSMSIKPKSLIDRIVSKDLIIEDMSPISKSLQVKNNFKELCALLITGILSWIRIKYKGKPKP